EPSGRPVPLSDQQDPPAAVEPALHIGQSSGGVPPVALDGARRRDRGLLVGELRVRREGAERPPGQADRTSVLAHLGDTPQRRGAEVDRRLAPRPGTRPGRLEELPRRTDEVARPGSYALWIADHDVRARR